MKAKKEVWMAWVWPGYHWYQGVAPMYAWQKDFAKYEVPMTKVVATYSKGTESFYFIREEYERQGEKFLQKILTRPEILSEVLQRTDEAALRIFDLGKRWGKLDFSGLSNRALVKAHQLLFKWDEQLWRKGQIPNLLELENSHLTKYVKSIIAKRFPKNLVEAFRIVTLNYEIQNFSIRPCGESKILPQISHLVLDKLEQYPSFVIQG